MSSRLSQPGKQRLTPLRNLIPEQHHMDEWRHLLIVDPDQEHIAKLQRLLTDEGYRLTTATTASEALDHLTITQFDLIILEYTLGDMAGLELCRRIRNHAMTPIMFVAAQNDVQSRVRALRAGADDYLPKSYNPAELTARIWAHLRRSKHFSSDTSTYINTALALDTNASKVTLAWNGKTIYLTRVEMRLLHYLVTNADRCIPRSALLIKGWGYAQPCTSNVLDVYISRLRTKIEPDPSQPRYLLTVRGLGYRFHADADQDHTLPDTQTPG